MTSQNLTPSTTVTDWDNYYQKPYKSASYSRKITGNYLTKIFKKYAPQTPFHLAELGGGNSCFFNLLNKLLNPKNYTIIDNNKIGLEKFTERLGNPSHVKVIEADVLNYQGVNDIFDFVYSIGLIEHFSIEGTEIAIKTHFDLLKKGGYALITYPTPTFLYRFTRKLAEITNLWIFHDERPLSKKEVLMHLNTLEEKSHGKLKLKICEHFINWPIFLTQGILVVQKL